MECILLHDWVNINIRRTNIDIFFNIQFKEHLRHHPILEKFVPPSQ